MSDETVATGVNMSADSGSQSATTAETLVKRRGRKPAKFWVSFTELDEPYKSRMASCRHCLATVSYHKKWEQAKSHLMRCDPFLKKMQSASASERPEWFVVELEKRRRSTSKMLPLDLLRGDAGPSQNGGVSSRSSPPEDAKTRKPSRLPSVELLVLQAMRTGAKIDEELVKHVLPHHRQDPVDGLKVLLERAHERVQRCVRQRLSVAASSGSAVLVVTWDERQSGVSYWVATRETSFFLETRLLRDQDREDPAKWLVEGVVRVLQSLEGGVRRVLVDAPLEWALQWMDKRHEDPKLQFRLSLRRVFSSMVRELLENGDADVGGPLEGWLAVALSCQDVLALAKTPGRRQNQLYDAWADDRRRIVAGTTRSIALTDALHAVVDAEGFLDSAVFRESLEKLGSVDDASIKRVCDVVVNTVFAAKLKQFLAVLKPLTGALRELSQPIVCASDVLVVLAKVTRTVKGDTVLTETHKDHVLKAVENYAHAFRQDEYLLAHLLDPAYLGEFLDDEAKREGEHQLLLRAGEADEDKQALYSEYTEFQVAGVQQQGHADGFVHRMLRERKKTVLQYWLTDGRRWPRLQAVAISVEQALADVKLPYQTLEEDASGLWDAQKMAYMRANTARLSLTELLEPAPPKPPLIAETHSRTDSPQTQGTDHGE